MYGKIFESMYEGSMVGSGPVVFAVWGYCIAKADNDSHEVLLNPALLASIIGTTAEQIESAILFLTLPDMKSKNQDHDGRRLLHQSGLSYLVVSHEHYRNINNRADVREYERLRKQKQRQKDIVPDSPGQPGTPVSVSVSVSDAQNGSAEGKHDVDFDAFWKAYPRRVGKKAAMKAWRLAKDRPAIEAIVSAVRKQETSEQWRRDGGQYIPHPATWLNQGRWADEPIRAKPLGRSFAP